MGRKLRDYRSYEGRRGGELKERRKRMGRQQRTTALKERREREGENMELKKERKDG